MSGLDRKATDPLETWTIYDHPRDYPDHFVVRRCSITREGLKPDPQAHLATSLEDARRLIPEGLYRMPRFADDDPVIVEVWI